MRAVVGGTVTGSEPWSYTDKKTGLVVEMVSVFVAGRGKYYDKIVAPASIGVPPVGSEVYYEADVTVSRREYQGKTYADLSAWATGFAQNPFAPQLAAVETKKTA
jgi:hypothetical protein